MNLKDMFLLSAVGIALLIGFLANNLLLWLCIGAGAGWALDYFMTKLRPEKEAKPSVLQQRLEADRAAQEASKEKKAV